MFWTVNSKKKPISKWLKQWRHGSLHSFKSKQQSRDGWFSCSTDSSRILFLSLSFIISAEFKIIRMICPHRSIYVLNRWTRKGQMDRKESSLHCQTLFLYSEGVNLGKKDDKRKTGSFRPIYLNNSLARGKFQDLPSHPTPPLELRLFQDGLHLLC